MHGIDNPVNVKALITALQAVLLSDAQTKYDALNNFLSGEHSDTQAQIASALAQLITKVEDEANQNQTILENITTVSGNLDENVLAINGHIDTKTAEVIAELLRTDAGSAHELLLNALTTVINTRATPANITAEGNATRAELVRTSAGSLYALLSAVVNAARDAVNSNVDAERAVIVGEMQSAKETLEGTDNRDLTDVYNLVGGRATPANVTAAQTAIETAITAMRDVLEGTSNRDLTDVYNRIPTSGWATPANVTAAQTAIETAITAMRDVLEGDSNRDLTDVYNLVNGRATPANITAAQTAIETAITAMRDVLEGTSNRDLTDVYNRIPTSGWATPANVTAAQSAIETAITTMRDVLEGASNRDLTDVYNLVNGRATPSDVSSAISNINSNVDSEHNTTRSSVNSARDSIKGSSARDLTQVYNLIDELALSPISSVQRGRGHYQSDNGTSIPASSYVDIPISTVNLSKSTFWFDITDRTMSDADYLNFELRSTSIRVHNSKIAAVSLQSYTFEVVEWS